MKNLRKITLGLAAFALLCSVSLAHFQMIYTPEGVVGSSKLPLKLIFTHPFAAGHTMNMGADQDGKGKAPLKFGVMTQKGEDEPEVTDLKADLKPITFTSLENSGSGYELDYKAKGMGDFVFFCDPGPYFEASEDAYIEQVTKVIINKGGAMTCVFEDVPGLPVQIKPLVRPYALWTGNVFRGVVQRWDEQSGAYVPVPYAEIEVEFANHEIDMKGNKFEENAAAEAPNDACECQTILADANGQFSYALPKAGWWGFAALGAGGDLEYKGKPLSVDAVIWAYAYDMKK